MISQDHIIIPLTLMDAKGEEKDEDNPLLVVHPDYIVDQ